MSIKDTFQKIKKWIDLDIQKGIEEKRVKKKQKLIEKYPESQFLIEKVFLGEASVEDIIKLRDKGISFNVVDEYIKCLINRGQFPPMTIEYLERNKKDLADFEKELIINSYFVIHNHVLDGPNYRDFQEYIIMEYIYGFYSEEEVINKISQLKINAPLTIDLIKSKSKNEQKLRKTFWKELKK